MLLINPTTLLFGFGLTSFKAGEGEVLFLHVNFVNVVLGVMIG